MERHRFDIVSFVFEIIFLGLGLTVMFIDEDITFLQARWIWPALLVVAGLAIVGFTLRKDTPEEAQEGSSYDPVS